MVVGVGDVAGVTLEYADGWVELYCFPGFQMIQMLELVHAHIIMNSSSVLDTGTKLHVGRSNWHGAMPLGSASVFLGKLNIYDLIFPLG